MSGRWRNYDQPADMKSIARFALEQLQQLGWGRLQKVDTGGRPCEVFVLHEADGNERQPEAE